MTGRLVIVATHDDRLTPLADRVIDLSPRARVAPGVHEVQLAAGESLFEMGDPPDFIYIVQRGEIELYRPLTDGGEELIGRRGAGEVFGDIGPLLGLPRSASARALEPTVLEAHGPQEFRHRWAGAGKVAI